MILFLLCVSALAYAADNGKLFYVQQDEHEWVQQKMAHCLQHSSKKDIAFGVSIPVGGYIIEINEYVQENGQKKWSDITITSPHLAASLQAIQTYKLQRQRIIVLAYQHSKE